MDKHTLKLLGYLALDVAAAIFAFIGEWVATDLPLSAVQKVAILAILGGVWTALASWLRYKFGLPKEEDDTEHEGEPSFLINPPPATYQFHDGTVDTHIDVTDTTTKG